MTDKTYWKESWARLAMLAVMIVLIAYAFSASFIKLEELWGNKEEYSHGYILPLVSLFIIWQRSEALRILPLKGAWAGSILMLIGALVFVLGVLSTTFVLMHYAVLIVIVGLTLSYVGARGLREFWAPLLLLFFAIPLPPFIYYQLSLKLQLISSELGVFFIRLFNISVYLEGNVIDLGNYKLQVVEACSGLRYLFPLMSMGFIMAYIFKAPYWRRGLVFVSTIPLTVIMNSIRIGIIGVMVNYWGTGMAEGFLHDFEGWLFFMVCMGILVGEIWLLSRLGTQKKPLSEVFSVDYPAPLPSNVPVQQRSFQLPLIGGLIVLSAAAILLPQLEQRSDIIPDRQTFSEFPDVIGNWHGRQERLEQVYLDELKTDDYIISNYQEPDKLSVNLYVAYYESQRSGAVVHSPRACIPGGGWEIGQLRVLTLADTWIKEQPLKVNRVQISKGSNRQLVYYWFQQRGQSITSEYMVKWYLLWDAITKRRTDGALVRVSTVIAPNENWIDGDRRLKQFVKEMTPQLKPFIPE